MKCRTLPLVVLSFAMLFPTASFAQQCYDRNSERSYGQNAVDFCKDPQRNRFDCDPEVNRRGMQRYTLALETYSMETLIRNGCFAEANLALQQSRPCFGAAFSDQAIAIGAAKFWQRCGVCPSEGWQQNWRSAFGNEHGTREREIYDRLDAQCSPLARCLAIVDEHKSFVDGMNNTIGAGTGGIVGGVGGLIGSSVEEFLRSYTDEYFDAERRNCQMNELQNVRPIIQGDPIFIYGNVENENDGALLVSPLNIDENGSVTSIADSVDETLLTLSKTVEDINLDTNSERRLVKILQEDFDPSVFMSGDYYAYRNYDGSVLFFSPKIVGTPSDSPLLAGRLMLNISN